MNSKVSQSIETALGKVKSGDTVALGGNVLHRSPLGAVRALIKMGLKDLTVIKTAGAHDVDLLCASNAASTVIAGFIGYETEFGLCDHFRKGVQAGEVEMKENACYTVIAGLRASAYGIPFMPIMGMDGSDLVLEDRFRMVKDPYTGQEVVAVKALRPDFAILHVQYADQYGNSKIQGPLYEDVLMASAAKSVIVTCEEIVDDEHFIHEPELVNIPGFMVDKVVCLPGGSAPGSCANFYAIDGKALEAFKSIKDKQEVYDYIESYSSTDEGGI